MHGGIDRGSSDLRLGNRFLAVGHHHQVRERPAPTRRLSGRRQRSSPDRGLRRGRERLGPGPGEQRRELPVPDAGSRTVHVEPARGSHAPGRALDPVDRREAPARRDIPDEPPVVVGSSDRQGGRLHPAERHGPPQGLPRHPTHGRHHAGPRRPLPQRDLPPLGPRARLRGRHRRRSGDLALVQRRRGSGAARLRGRGDDVRGARLHGRRANAAVRRGPWRRRAAPARARPHRPHDQPGSVARGCRRPDLGDLHPAEADGDGWSR